MGLAVISSVAGLRSCQLPQLTWLCAFDAEGHNVNAASGSLGNLTANQHDVPFPPIADSTPAYSITSSTRAKIESGLANPIAFAVLRLRTMSNFVACSTGRSAGFTPLKILSTKY